MALLHSAGFACFTLLLCDFFFLQKYNIDKFLYTDSCLPISLGSKSASLLSAQW